MIDTQIGFAALLGVSEYSLNRWEQQKAQPGIKTLVKIHLALKPLIPDLHIEDLLELDD